MTSGAWPMPSPRSAAAAPRSPDPCPRGEYPVWRSCGSTASTRAAATPGRPASATAGACPRPPRASRPTAPSTSSAPCSVLARTHPLPAGMDAWLGRIQNDLFDLGADLCVPEEEHRPPVDARAHAAARHAGAGRVARGGAATRSTRRCRRSRRSCSRAARRGGGAAPGAHGLPARRARRGRAGRERAGRRGGAAYLNRLSDLLFLLARAATTTAAGGAVAPGRSLLGAGPGEAAGVILPTWRRPRRARGAARDALRHPGRAALLARDDAARLRRDAGRSRQLPVHARRRTRRCTAGRLWTMRMFAGFGTADETNERFHYLLEQGQTGLSTAFDMPTLMGYDSDHAARARRGRPRGRRDRHPGRHGGPVRGASRSTRSPSR